MKPAKAKDDSLTIYHNPACSKSRETLALIKASGITPRVVEYLKTPPSEAELTVIVHKLGMAPSELVRTNESVFRQKYSGKTLSDQQWIQALAADPILLIFRRNDHLSTFRRSMDRVDHHVHQRLHHRVAVRMAKRDVAAPCRRIARGDQLETRTQRFDAADEQVAKGLTFGK